MFRFDDTKDRNHILNQTWFLRGQPFVLREWTPHVEFDSSSLERIPMWIHLMGLDLDFFGQRAIDKPASEIGYRMHADLLIAEGERISYA